jgi:hypothetical protein
MRVRGVTYATVWVCALVLAGQPVAAQQAQQGGADDHALVLQLLERVVELEQQVKAEQGGAGAPAETTPAPAETATPRQAEAHDMPGATSACCRFAGSLT